MISFIEVENLQTAVPLCKCSCRKHGVGTVLKSHSRLLWDVGKKGVKKNAGRRGEDG